MIGMIMSACESGGVGNVGISEAAQAGDRKRTRM